MVSQQKTHVDAEAFHRRLTQLMAGRTIYAFARAVGIHPSSLYGLRDRMGVPESTTLAKIAAATGVTVDWLLTGARPSAAPEDESGRDVSAADADDRYLLALRHARSVPVEIIATAVTSDEARDEAAPPADPGRRLVWVPRLNVRASAGPGAFDAEPWMQVTGEWMHAEGILKPVMVEAVGDSMAPTIQPGDELLLDLAVERVLRDGIYVLSSSGAVLVKRLVPQWDGGLLIRSDNPVFPDERVPPGRVEEVRVTGQVRRIVRRC